MGIQETRRKGYLYWSWRPVSQSTDIIQLHFHLTLRQSTRVVYSVFVMHRRKDLWGPDGQHTCPMKILIIANLRAHCTALEFDPDRFLDERMQKYVVPNPFIFLPFNAGPRICLGQQVRQNPIPPW